MATNINLVSPENEKKSSFSGKLVLLVSVILVVLSLLGYGVVSALSANYARLKNNSATKIQEEKNKIASPEYADVVDFQERLILLEKIINDHFSYDAYVRNFSRYILPDVRISSLDMTESGEEIGFTGNAANFEVISRELMLLESSPIVESVEFNEASESSSETSGNSVEFSVTLKTKKEFLK